MRTFSGFVTKEFYHIVRDRRTLLILFGMPIIQLVLFGFAIRNEIEDIEIAVVDHAHDEITQDLTDKLLASGYFVVVDYPTSDAALETAFQHGRIKQAILFEANFAQRLRREGTASVQVITDASDPNMANRMLSYTSAIFADYERQLASSIRQGDAQIIPTVRMRFNPSLESVYLFVPGLIAVILMLISALMTSITITREKEMGTMEVLLVSPLRPTQIIIGKVLPYMALAFINVVTILVLAKLVFAVPVRGSIPLLLLECLLFIVCALSLGILISTRSESLQTATMVSLAGLLLPTVILSGFIFPISSMPEPLQWLSHIIPAKWFLIIIRSIMIKGVGLAYFWQETLVLTGMTLFFLTISVRNFNVRLE